MDIAQRSFRIEGRVQGVGFRWWARREGERLGLVGTVRNMPDGSVEVVAEGPNAAVGELHRLLEKGPPSSFVSRVISSPAPPPRVDSFSIIE